MKKSEKDEEDNRDIFEKVLDVANNPLVTVPLGVYLGQKFGGRVAKKILGPGAAKKAAAAKKYADQVESVVGPIVPIRVNLRDAKNLEMARKAKPYDDYRGLVGVGRLHGGVLGGTAAIWAGTKSKKSTTKRNRK